MARISERKGLFQLVEADLPAFSGMLHIFNGDQLESRCRRGRLL